MTVDELTTLALHDQARFKRTVLHPLVDACKTTKGRNGYFRFELSDGDEIAVCMYGAEWTVSRDHSRDGGRGTYGSIFYLKERTDAAATCAPWVLTGLLEVCGDPHAALQRTKDRDQASVAARAQARTQERQAAETARQAQVQALATTHAATLARITVAVAALCDHLAPGVARLSLHVPLAAEAICRIERSETGERIVIAKQLFFGDQYRDPVAVLVRKGDAWIRLYAKGEWSTVADLIEATAADPFAVAKHIQRCVFCARELTDTMSRAMGYGPDCARSWGRPWGQPSKGVAPQLPLG